MDFVEMIRKIQGLKEIKYVAWHIFEDDAVAPTTLIEAEDQEGNRVEIKAVDIYGYDNSKLFVLVSVLMNKVLNSPVMPFPETLAADVNKARERYPYKDKEWVNEERARMYDHVTPEKKF